MGPGADCLVGVRGPGGRGGAGWEENEPFLGSMELTSFSSSHRTDCCRSRVTGMWAWPWLGVPLRTAPHFIPAPYPQGQHIANSGFWEGSKPGAFPGLDGPAQPLCRVTAGARWTV